MSVLGVFGTSFRGLGSLPTIASLAPLVARRSLRPQLNQIRAWVRQGRTDAWIAHQLEVSPRDIGAFKREHDLAPEEAGDDGADAGVPLAEEERDMRAEDDALVAAELDAMDEGDESEEGEPAEPKDSRDGGDSADDEDSDDRPKRRRRGRRGGRRRRGSRTALEGTFDHGEEGYGLWLDPAVQDDAVYAEHWAGHRPVTVAVEPNRIVIRRLGDEAEGDTEDADA